MKNNLLILTWIFLSFTSFTSFSQINFSIKGKIIMEDGYLPSGNIIALHPKDSTFLSGDSFFDGIFELNDLTDDEVLIEFSSLEFDRTFLTIKYQNNLMIDLGEILVKNSQVALNEIVVKGRRPIYRQKSDGTVEVLIANTTLAASNSVQEILSKSPEIITDESGGISVFGKGNAILYLNGKRITSNQLAFISPSNIQKIEIIRNPSSKYDAEGGAVINISTIQRNDNGYQINLKQNVSHSDFGGTNFLSSVNFNHTYNRLSSNAYYTLLQGNDREQLYTTRDRKPEDIFLKTDLTTDWLRDYENTSSYGVGLQLDGENNNYVSIEYSGSLEQLGGNQISKNKITDDAGVSVFKSDIERDERETNNSISLNYNQVFDTLGTVLFFGGQFSDFQGNNDNLISEKTELENENLSRVLKNISGLDINIFSAQTDFTKKYKNKNTLELGAKYSFIKNSSSLDFLVADSDLNFISDSNLSNFFNYKEHISAGYFTFKSSFRKNINYEFGLRAEYTDYSLEVSSENDLIEDKYLNLFPNISTNITFTDNFNLNFSYAARINRPAYRRLNPVIIYQDPYTSIQGNPNLIPEKTHAFEVSSRLKKTTFKIGYNYTIDPLGARALRGDNDRSYILIPGNYDLRHSFFSSVSRTFSNDWWTSINTFSIRHTNIIDTQFEIERIEPRPSPYFYSNNIFRVSNLFNVEVLFWYLGDRYTGVTHRRESSNMTISVEKSFLNKKLKCRLIANDIFYKNIAAGSYNVGQTDIYFNRRWSTNYFRFSMIYNFGKLKKNNYKNKSIGESERNRI